MGEQDPGTMTSSAFWPEADLEELQKWWVQFYDFVADKSFVHAELEEDFVEKFMDFLSRWPDLFGMPAEEHMKVHEAMKTALEVEKHWRPLKDGPTSEQAIAEVVGMPSKVASLRRAWLQAASAWEGLQALSKEVLPPALWKYDSVHKKVDTFVQRMCDVLSKFDHQYLQGCLKGLLKVGGGMQNGTRWTEPYDKRTSIKTVMAKLQRGP